MRRTGSRRRRSPAAAFPTGDSRCRLASRIAPAASCASKPARSRPTQPRRRAINMAAKAPLVERERRNLAFFETLPDNNARGRGRRPGARRAVPHAAVRVLRRVRRDAGRRRISGCSRSFRRPAARRECDRLLVHLRRQPADDAVVGQHQGRGPAWANSLFEDNAEFGLGYRLSLDKHREQAKELLRALAPELGPIRVRECWRRRK